MIRFDRRAAIVGASALTLTLGTGVARADSSGMDWLGIVYLWASDI
jgi:hypothetical protein